MIVGGERVIPSYQPEWCTALHGNHDEHQCRLKPGHEKRNGKPDTYDFHHQCYCGVWW